MNNNVLGHLRQEDKGAPEENHAWKYSVGLGF